MTLQVALADDEPLARARLGRLLREAGCEVVQEFADGASLLEWWKQGANVDALFLDIQMPGLSGLEVMAEITERAGHPSVVFVTAFSEHAVRAFEAAAADYILKPISKERLAKSLERVSASRAKAVHPESLERHDEHRTHGKGRFPVRAGNGHVFLELKRVTHFEVEDEEVYAHTVSNGQLTRHRTEWSSLGEVEAAFPEAGLLRIQRHILLRPEAVLGFKALDGGRASLRLAEGVDLEVSRSATPKVKERLGL